MNAVLIILKGGMKVMYNADTYKEPGRMSMPVNFRHADVFRRGRPRHGKPGILY